MAIVQVLRATVVVIETTLTPELEGLIVVTAGRMVVAPIGVEIAATKRQDTKMQQRSVTVWVGVIATAFQLPQPKNEV